MTFEGCPHLAVLIQEVEDYDIEVWLADHADEVRSKIRNISTGLVAQEKMKLFREWQTRERLALTREYEAWCAEQYQKIKADYGGEIHQVLNKIIGSAGKSVLG